VLVLAVAIAALPSCGTTVDERPPSPQPVYANELRAGPGRLIAMQRCLTCHSATLLTQQHKDSTAWAKTVAQMEKWGAAVSAAERDTLLAYLAGGPGVP
jgi:hypothetical protein